MAKKLCELCQKEYESDMRFGIRLCQNCLDGYSKAMSGDIDVATQFSNPQDFPNASEQAKNIIIGGIAKRIHRVEANAQEKHQENLQQKELKEKEHRRESYAKAVGVTYKEKIDNTDSMFDSLYADIGKKIKGWAGWIFIVEAIVSVIGAIVMLFTAEDGGMIFVALLTLILGPVLVWVSSWILYAFGELVDKTCENERNTQNILKLMLENNTKDETK